mgnify:FL=1
MGKCLITKLNGVAENNSLLKIGEMRIIMKKIASPSYMSQGFTVTFAEDVLLEIIGNGYFTDETLSKNTGKTKKFLANQMASFWVSNGDYEISIPNKYAIVSIFFYPMPENGTQTEEQMYSKATDLSYFKYSKKMTAVNVQSKESSGSLEDLAYCLSLTSISLSKAMGIYGNISSLSKLSALKRLTLIDNQKITGDLASLPGNVFYIDGQNGGIFSWVATRPSSANIIAMRMVNLGTYVDNMLINQANCTAPSDATEKTIQCRGTRTSASDAAVQTLQSKGYTVSITPA